MVGQKEVRRYCFTRNVMSINAPEVCRSIVQVEDKEMRQMRKTANQEKAEDLSLHSLDLFPWAF